MPTKIVTTITSPGKLRLAVLFKSTSEPAGPVFDYVAGKESWAEVLTGYGLVAEVIWTSGNTRPRDKPGRGRRPPRRAGGVPLLKRQRDTTRSEHDNAAHHE